MGNRSAGRVAETTRVVEINDLDGLERELAEGDVAACLFEPALTNVGIVLPDPATTRPSGSSPGATGPCSSSTRPTRSAPGPAATRARMAWSPTSS